MNSTTTCKGYIHPQCSEVKEAQYGATTCGGNYSDFQAHFQLLSQIPLQRTTEQKASYCVRQVHVLK